MSGILYDEMFQQPKEQYNDAKVTQFLSQDELQKWDKVLEQLSKLKKHGINVYLVPLYLDRKQGDVWWTDYTYPFVETELDLKFNYDDPHVVLEIKVNDDGSMNEERCIQMYHQMTSETMPHFNVFLGQLDDVARWGGSAHKTIRICLNEAHLEDSYGDHAVELI